MKGDWQSELWYDFNFCLAFTTYTLGFSYRSVGSHHMPRTGPVLIVSNHESFLDPLAVGLAVRRRIHYLARKPLFRPGLFGKFLSSVGCVPVDQAGVAKEGLKTSVELLKQGKALLVFPEGERTFTGEMRPFKPGIALIMRMVKAPIVPVGVAGAYEAFPRTARYPRFSPLFWPANGYAVATAVGQAIPSERFAHMKREQILEDLFAEVRKQVARAEKVLRR